MRATDISRRTILGVFAAGSLWQTKAKVSGEEVMYVGGTIGSLPEATEGTVDL